MPMRGAIAAIDIYQVEEYIAKNVEKIVYDMEIDRVKLRDFYRSKRSSSGGRKLRK